MKEKLQENVNMFAVSLGVLIIHQFQNCLCSDYPLNRKGSATILLCIFGIIVIISGADAATGSCPLASKINGCSPKCQQTYDCNHGKVCCPNACNAKSCVDLATFGGSNNDKYSQSGGTGTYCNNEKCRPSEVCKMDPTTRRMKCSRP